MTCKEIAQILPQITFDGELISWHIYNNTENNLLVRGQITNTDYVPVPLTFDVEVTNFGDDNFEIICNVSSKYGEGYFENLKVKIENTEDAIKEINTAISSAVYNGEIDNLLGGGLIMPENRKDTQITPDYSGEQLGSIQVESTSSATDSKATLEDFNIEILENDLTVKGNDINLKPITFNDKELVARGYVTAPIGDFDLEVNVEKIGEHSFEVSVFVESTLGAGEYSGTFEDVLQNEVKQILKICIQRCFENSGELRGLLENKCMKESKTYTPYRNKFFKESK